MADAPGPAPHTLRDMLDLLERELSRTEASHKEMDALAVRFECAVIRGDLARVSAAKMWCEPRTARVARALVDAPLEYDLSMRVGEVRALAHAQVEHVNVTVGFTR